MAATSISIESAAKVACSVLYTSVNIAISMFKVWRALVNDAYCHISVTVYCILLPTHLRKYVMAATSISIESAAKVACSVLYTSVNIAISILKCGVHS